MVRIGDTVIVTIPTYYPSGNPYTASSQLQQHLRLAGFEVLGFNDSALPFFGVLSGRGNLIISVSPQVTDYNSAQDVAATVAGAAYAEGYDIDAGAMGQLITGAADNNYRDLQNHPNVNDEVPLGFELSTGVVLGIAAAAVTLAVVLSRR